jgi:hypothetical protein
MKAIILIERGSYGFGHNWSLVLTKSNGTSKSFYLGQDVKFCNRVLGMEPRYIVEQIGSGNITEPSINTRLANFIIYSLDTTKKELFNLEAWSLCAE